MPNSLQGLQNQLFAVFMLLTIFSNFCQQIMPHFVTQRALYEARERPSKTYSWQAFILSNIIVEIPWNSLMAVLIFVGWYYPIGLRQNAVEADQVAERGALMFLLILAFLIFAGTFTSMVTAGIETAEAAGNITNLLFSLSLIFCGYVTASSTLLAAPLFPFSLSPLSRAPSIAFEESILIQIPQRPRNPRHSTRRLDLHVPRLPFHIPPLGHAIRRPRQRARLLLHRRIPAFLPSSRLELLHLPRPLHRGVWRLPHI